jgi:hypothetical protein
VSCKKKEKKKRRGEGDEVKGTRKLVLTLLVGIEITGTFLNRKVAVFVKILMCSYIETSKWTLRHLF